MSNSQDHLLDLEQAVEIKAAIGDTYRSLIRRLSVDNSTPDNKPLPMVLEEWPGGRWFRDLGGSQGHLWGFVQVIKPPTLLEICGPLFMSYAVSGHVQFRLTQIPGGVELVMRHRAFGLIEDSHRQGVVPGWQHILDQTRQDAEAGRR
ncbi:SRPBCC domain-containing protein [bacterium]|nr:SRPBCC domain-containing protein [bacterium]